MTPECATPSTSDETSWSRCDDALIDTAITEREPWTANSAPRHPTRDATTWRPHARTVAAYRDRYSITGDDPLGPHPGTAAQRGDATRARIALQQACASAVDNARSADPALAQTHTARRVPMAAVS